MSSRSRFWRLAAASPFLFGALGAGLLLPMPDTHNERHSRVVGEVRQRMPGWHVDATESWESAWAVVATCGAETVGFQLIPEHGLPVGDAWVQPNDPESRAHLAYLTDHTRYLIWRGQRARPNALACRNGTPVAAGTGGGASAPIDPASRFE